MDKVNFSKTIQDEMDKLDWETELYWRELDEQAEHTDWDKIHEAQKAQYAEMLKGELGEDIKNVTSGKVKVKLPWRLKIKYWFERLFKFI